MKKRYAFLVGLLFLLQLVNSCNNNSDKPAISQSVDSKQEFSKIIPKDNSGKLNFSYRMTKDYTRQTRLNIIENGFDSIFIRLWYSYNADIQVVDLKKESGIWTAEFYAMKRVIERIGDTLRVIKMESIKKYPKSGWDFFINRILSLGIMTLPDNSELPEFNLPSDATFVVVEIATTTKYRIYSYGMPMLFPEIKETKSMEDIMVLIEEEFGVKRVEIF